MGTQAWPATSAPKPSRPEWRRVRTAGLFVLENLLLAGGYALAAWLGRCLTLTNRPPLLWPAAGFALAVLLVRGGSRWPAILLGSLLVSGVWLVESGAPSSFLEPISALLTGTARVLATVVGARMLRRWMGPTHWPPSVRGVAGFIAIGGLLYPALASVLTDLALLSSGNAASAATSLRELWIWFSANSTGTLLVAPAILVFASRTRVLPRRSRWEAALLGLLFLASGLFSWRFGRMLGVGDLLGYALTVPMLWATLRFGSRGAVFDIVVRSTLIISFELLPRAEEVLPSVFLQLQARLMVLASFALCLGAAVEERHVTRRLLEQERQNLERRVAERTRELAQSLSLLNSSLESTADGLLVVDRSRHIIVMNQRFAELWGIPTSLLESGDEAPLLAFADEQVVDAQAFHAQVQHLYEHPEQESADEIHLKSGRIFERISRPQCLGDAIIGRVWSIRDVTPRRLAEAERDRLLVEERRARESAEQAYQQAHRALELRDEFLGIAAHELRTPLTSMKAQFQQLERVVATDPDGHLPASRVKTVVAATSRQLKRFQDLSHQLLDFTRLTLGQLELRYEPLDFRELVAEQLEHHADLASRVGSELRLESSGPVLGEWDRPRLEQIVGHLLSNAIKFGAGHPVTVRLEAVGGHAHLQVIDGGIGIAPEDQERIFERLERAVDARHYGGLGLGLWIARRSAEALGGVVQVESAPGKGSMFTVELPQLPQPSKTAPPVAWDRHPPA